MNMLTPYLAHDPIESLLGTAARLAGFHTGGRTGPFLRDIGVSLPGLARGQAQDIQRLAERSGVAAEVLGANAARGLDRRHFDLRGEHVSAEMFASPFTVFCPACLRADDLASGGKPAMRRHRWIWQLGVVRTCPDHGLPLLRRKAAFSGGRYHELAIMVPETGDRLEALVAPLTARSVSSLQNYVLDRLAGKAAVEIVHLILGGFLSNVVRLDGLEGFAAIHVDPRETKTGMSEVMKGLSPVEAFGRIRVPVASGWELVKEGLLPVVEIPSKRDHHVIYRFRPEDVDAFLGEFTTEAWIGNALDMGLSDLKPEMQAAGVKPFLRKTEIGIRIFRRCDLPARYQV